jgi:DNA processing protein
MSAQDVRAQHMWSEACAAALVGLWRMGPQRLATLLLDLPPEAAWQLIADGSPLPPGMAPPTKKERDLFNRWRAEAQRTDPFDVLERYQHAGVSVRSRFDRYPDRLVGDPDAPAVLFFAGDETALTRPTVAIIGTRHCSHEGRATARQFGTELAEAGVSVVSGLALGIDGASHEGALRASFGAPPIGVVGSGLDVVYPKRHRDLWRNVKEQGLLVSESPLGALPEAWRFPARNRIIAGLADLVLVIESHERGGSMITVDEAVARSVPIMAVPGSVRNASARGSNRLLGDVAAPACSTDDVLQELKWELAVGKAPSAPAIDQRRTVDLEPRDQLVLDAIDHSPTSTGEILLRTAMSLPEVATSLGRLSSRGCIDGQAGWWHRVDGASADD